MKGAYWDPIDHARTTQPRAGESFIDTLWWPGLLLLGIGTILIACTVAASAYGNSGLSLTLALIAGAIVTAGTVLITLEHRRVNRVERRWRAEHPDGAPRLRAS
ncbi:protein UsfY [[Mycobacterium] wendilense]|uniref:Protein UsfY n=1 Tax=[Mycobacterium] wendilense TaxID=3064284 RepID=A0ABM9MHM2_9MYCO|nr:protein UsfY [Mycolicibacterium sp. MU0050]CAJ1585433.1 protein UsfY [Mycolicibacterium sp. MU0050]